MFIAVWSPLSPIVKVVVLCHFQCILALIYGVFCPYIVIYRCRNLLIVLSVMEDDIEVVIHREGKFMSERCLKYEGEINTLTFDPNLWSYFVVVSVVK